LADLNSKVEDLQELYKDHDTKYLELKNKCQLAEQNSFNLYKMANDWKNKVLSAQQGLEAFEMVKSYERIADSLEQAHNHSKHVLDQYKDAKNNLDELSTQTDELKSRNEKLTAKLNQELEKKVKAESDYVRLNGQYSELDSRAKQLNKSLLKLDEWINKTVESDQTLAQLKRELDNQQADLTSSERVADDLIRRIQSLDTLRNSLKPPETNPDETSQTNDQQLVASIENSIESLKANGPAINQTIKKLLDENNFNAELEKISKDIYDLRILIESTRQIANNIKVAVNFNDSTLLNLKPPVDLHPAMTTTGSIYIKTRGM
jgi:chromosome segregation ATPase